MSKVIRGARHFAALLLGCGIIFTYASQPVVRPAMPAASPASTTSRYLYENWTTEKGLPQNSVNSIIQSRDGYLWFATYGGLVRFDGVKVTIFDAGSNPGLLSNRISTLYEDHAGNLWIGTEHSGLVKFSGGSFTAFTTKEGLPDNRIHSICEDAQGNLWVSTSSGLAHLQDGAFLVQGGIAGTTGFIRRGYDDRLWVLTEKGIVENRNGAFVPVAFVNNQPITWIRDMYGSRDGSFWVSTAKALLRFEKDKAVTVLSYAPSPPPDAADDSPKVTSDVVLKMFEDRQGNLCFVTPGGLLRYQNGGLTTFSQSEELIQFTKNPFSLRCVLADEEGTIWIGTDGKGLYKIKQAQVTAYGEAEGLSNKSFIAVAGGEGDELWIGGPSLYRYHAGVFTDLEQTGGNIWSLCRDRNGNLWYGRYDGLHRLKDGRSTLFDEKNSNLTGMPVAAIFEDRDGNLWIGTGRDKGREGGLFRLKGESFVAYQTNEGLVYNDVRFITQDHEGALWVGGQGGLSRFKDGSFTNYTTENGLPNSYVRAIYEDADGALWVGTYGGGLCRFKNGKFATITTKDGLFDNVISRILEDEQGSFWMSCNRGVYRASRQELNEFADGKRKSVASVPYGVSDGMGSSECNGGGQPAGWKDSEGKLWFPTQKGVAVIAPKKMNPLPPPVRVEQVLIDKVPVNLADKVAVPPGHRDLEIQYTALSFIAPEKVRFRYKLEGYDENWVEAGTRRVAYYTNLAPGSYTFRVVACNNDGVWNEAGTILNFDLQPHFYQTKLFYVLWALALMLLGLAGYRLRVMHLVRRNQLLEKRIAERTAQILEQKNRLKRTNDELAHARDAAEAANRAKSAFLANMSHELRTPLNAVIGYSEMLAEEASDFGYVKFITDLKKINSAGKHLLDLINNVLDLSKIEAGRMDLFVELFDIKALVQEIGSVIESAVAKNENTLQVSFDEGVGSMKADITRVKQSLFNLLSNACKFTRGGTISLRVSRRHDDAGDAICFTVSDTGIGMTEEQLARLFQPFTQADASTTRQFGGTGLGLTITQRFCEMMGGTITAQSEYGKGSAFTITLPAEVKEIRIRQAVEKSAHGYLCPVS